MVKSDQAMSMYVLMLVLHFLPRPSPLVLELLECQRPLQLLLVPHELLRPVAGVQALPVAELDQAHADLHPRAVAPPLRVRVPLRLPLQPPHRLQLQPSPLLQLPPKATLL